MKNLTAFSAFKIFGGETFASLQKFKCFKKPLHAKKITEIIKDLR